MASIGQKLSFIHPWNWAWALLHVWWMNTWREVSSATQIWPTVTMLWVMWSMPKVSGKKRMRGETTEGRLCLVGDHPLGIFLAGSWCSRHWTGFRGKNTPSHQAFIIQRTRKTVQTHQHHVPRSATLGWPLGTVTKPSKNIVAYLLSEKQNCHLLNNIYKCI